MTDDSGSKLIEDVGYYLRGINEFNTKVINALNNHYTLGSISRLISGYLDSIKHEFTKVLDINNFPSTRRHFDIKLTRFILTKYWGISSRYLNLDSEKEPAEKIIAHQLILDTEFMPAFNRLLTAKSATYRLQELVRNHDSKISWASTSSMAVIIWMNHLLGEDGKNEKWSYLQFPPISQALPQESTSQEKENEIMASKFFELKPFVNGKEFNIKDIGSVFQDISAQECHIKHLETVEHKPQILVDEIASAKADLAALVAYLDSKSTPSTPPAA